MEHYRHEKESFTTVKSSMLLCFYVKNRISILENFKKIAFPFLKNFNI